MNREPSLATAPKCRNGYVSPSGIKVQYSRDWVKYHPIEGDGMRALLYMHLWKNSKGNESKLKNIRLPDTVVYEHNFPRAWYTYDVEAREINKYPGKMLDAQSIYLQFSQTQSDCDVVAQFLTTCSPEDPAATPPAKEKGLLTYVEFFTAETLREFLFSPARKPDGVLQKFVLPRGTISKRRNTQLQVIWSPVVTVVYKRTNRHRLDEHSLPVHVRSATFDGDNHLSELSLVSDESKSRLERLCREVVDHFYFTERKLITRMVMNFKVDDENRPWLLWCTSLRISGDSLNPRNVRIPSMLFMRMEVLNDGSSTKERISKRLELQKRLIMMDCQLFDLSRDYDFGHHCNASHVREAKRLGLVRKGGNNSAKVKRCNPPHPMQEAMRYFDIMDKLPSASGEANRTLEDISLSSVPLMPSLGLSCRGSSAPNDTEGRVKSELIAMALDAWYSVYSSTLSGEPDCMPTRSVELAEALVEVLQPLELEQLAEILGIEPESTESGKSQRYFVRLGILGPGRRFDRPLINAERDVREFFDELFTLRGGEIVQQCLSKERWVW